MLECARASLGLCAACRSSFQEQLMAAATPGRAPCCAHRHKVVQVVQSYPPLLEMSPHTISANFTRFKQLAAESAPGITLSELTEVGCGAEQRKWLGHTRALCNRPACKGCQGCS